MLNVNRLLLLREVAARGTIAAVAEALAFTPSAVSQQLTKFEVEIGAPLLERSGRGVRLTEIGTALVASSDEVFRALDRAEAAAEEAKGEPGGVVRIGAFASGATELVAPAIRTLASTAPRLRIELEEMEDPAAILGLRLGELDLIILQDFTNVPTQAPAGTNRHPLLDDPLVIAVPKRWKLDEVESLAAFRDRPWIAEPEANPSGRALRHACRAAGFEPEIRYVVQSFQLMAALVDRGLGVAMVPNLILVNRRRGLRLVPSAGLIRHIYAATRHERALRPGVRACLAAIEGAAAELRAQ